MPPSTCNAPVTPRPKRSVRGHARIAVAVVVAALIATLSTEERAPAAPTNNTDASFSLRLYRELSSTNSQTNLVVSPYSVAEAVAMLAAGARGATKTQLDTVLTGTGHQINPTQRLALRTAITGQPFADAGSSVTVANGIWTLTGYPLTDDYRRTVTTSYAATTRELAFATDPSGAAKTINAWISAATDARITNLVNPSSFNKFTRLVITNAVLFRGRWTDQFNPALTTRARFTRSTGKAISVPTMHGTATVSNTADPRIITLPFANNSYMRIALPRTSTRTGLDSAMAALHQPVDRDNTDTCGDVDIALPKWKAEATFDKLADTLRKFGVTGSDYAGISPQAATEGLGVAAITHRANIDVDEQGTIAAAATAIVAEAVSETPRFGPCPKRVDLNRPFVYVIQQMTTGEVLFAGCVDRPGAP